ncbi:LETM1 domain-containing protein mdm28, mitochondrial [Ceratocystis fimbriata CBS 114723]|uniref:LETM1 domain-containing protein mdm28, mitochondrial n=1 Tax=Ceratocystis fimbriata CBS 114723 TaxID=1035309 RepID=A0A2C5XBQ7_9PEZI|nr:LETM1 domain-containing protein mdm28, mitochondrial [Ceratocystis fimbriata CBS 114723]
MSATAAVARRTVTPLVGRSLSRSQFAAANSLLIRNARTVPLFTPAVSLLSSRYVSTEPHRPGMPPGPPPGFNAEVARKPLPRDVAFKKEPSGTSKSVQSELANKTVAATAELSQQTSSQQMSKDGNASLSTPKTDAEIAAAKEEHEKNMTLWEKIKHEANHYWDGSKLLAAEVKISTRLALKMMAGYELTRRENRQLRRTVQDVARLVPFSVFVIVPFAELLLPFALRLFPGMLPSTFEGDKSRAAKASILRATRKEVSTFLQSTLQETGIPLAIASSQKEEFRHFFTKLRSTGEKPEDSAVIRICQMFKDDLTLDNLSRPQLVSMCRYMNLGTLGNDGMLRYQVRHRMRQIKRDDRAISFEGIDNLTPGEVQTACASRGIRTYGVSPARMRADLQTWLNLRLKEGVPSTLLVLSNAYMYSGDMTSQVDALMNVLSSIPEELYHEIELEVHNAEGAATNKQRLEVLKEQQELIEDEAKQDEVHETTGMAAPRDNANIDEREERVAAQPDVLEAKVAGEVAAAEAETIKAVKGAPTSETGAAVESKTKQE